nr:GMC family oxidoreductase [Parvularcula dongshanensis]
MRTRDTDAPLEADVVIVGAGPAGLTLAHELIGTGRRVLVLESGGFELEEETQDLYRGALTGHQKTDIAWSRLRYFGGTTGHWGGHCLPLDEVDFGTVPGRTAAWPMSRADLDPYYARAHEYCDLGAYDYAVDEDWTRRFGPQLDVDPADFTHVMMRQSGPTRFGAKYRGVFEDTRDVDVLLHANVTDIVPDAMGTRVKRLSVSTLDGRKAEVRARIFVLATGGIENARLLLNARTLSDQGLGNASDLVGRYFMDHPQGGIGFLHLNEPWDMGLFLGEKPTPDGVPSYYNLRPSDEAIRRDGLVNATLWLTPIRLATAPPTKREQARDARDGLKSLFGSTLRGKANPDFNRDLCDALIGVDELAASLVRERLGVYGVEPVDRKVLVRFESEQSPTPDSRVSLIGDTDPLGLNRVALDWRPAASDLEALQRMGAMFGQGFAAAGLGRFEFEDKEGLPYLNVGTAWHHMGTTRMSASPRQGVVDADMKLHGFGNLYVAGGSVFPSGGRSNPTLTIVALSVRLADHLKSIRISSL